MPKLIDYPRASFKNSKELADAVDYLGGSCSVESCADKMGLKVSGSFSALIASATKYALIDNSRGTLTTTQLYKDIKLSYTDQERLNNFAKAFLAPSLFRKVYDRFLGKELPIQMLDKLFIREFEVDQDSASRIKRYFIDGLKEFLLINEKNVLVPSPDSEKHDSPQKEEPVFEEEPGNNPAPIKPVNSAAILKENVMQRGENEFVIHITGPSMDSKIVLKEEEDLIILEAMINKIKKRFL